MESTLETAETFYKTPALVSDRVRCGKTTCRCAGGARYRSDWFPQWREGGIHSRHYVRCADLLDVRVIVERRRPDTWDVGVTPP